MALYATTVRWQDSDEKNERALADGDAGFVEKLVRQLDGNYRNLMPVSQSFYDSNDVPPYLCVGGDASTGLVLFVSYDNESFFELTNPEREPEPQVEVVAGGSPGDYPGHYVVTIEAAVQATRTFMNDGTLDSSLTWEEY